MRLAILLTGLFSPIYESRVRLAKPCVTSLAKQLSICMTMTKSRSYDVQDLQSSGEHEQSSFLASVDHETESVAPQRAPLRRQPSIAQPVPPGTPRTPRTLNRVRFEIEDTGDGLDGHVRRSREGSEAWLEEEDYFSGGRRISTGQRAPLLTDIEAPSVTTALEINAEDSLESARPKSGMSSAFMNMANSIIGAGIIGI